MINVFEAPIFIFLVSFALVALWIIAIVDVLTNKFKGSFKLLWIIIIILLPVPGVILYLTIGRKQIVTR